MDSKKIGSAVIKRDSIENWLKAKNYIPPIGTIIMMEDEGKSVKIRFGDGKTYVNDLPDMLLNNNYFTASAPIFYTFYEEEELLEFKNL